MNPVGEETCSPHSHISPLCDSPAGIGQRTDSEERSQQRPETCELEAKTEYPATETDPATSVAGKHSQCLG